MGTELSGVSSPARSVESAAGSETILPPQLLRWMSVDRGAMNRFFRGDRSTDRDRCPGTMPVMFPAEVPYLPSDTVAVSMGPLPREDIIGEFTDLFRDACLKRDPEVIMESALWFYSNPRNFDQAAMGGLLPPSDGARSAANVQGSVVIMGGPPELKGRQMEGTIEVLGPGDDQYDFLLQAWNLFVARNGGAAKGEMDRACLFRID
ncbi:MAG: hypothetical protein SA339_02140 [Methanomassiliicoccus sp.]|nr:hypothetical protein [Methanomassiliicoccus sp.]